MSAFGGKADQANPAGRPRSTRMNFGRLKIRLSGLHLPTRAAEVAKAWSVDP
jgi:hypothetical protein